VDRAHQFHEYSSCAHAATAISFVQKTLKARHLSQPPGFSLAEARGSLCWRTIFDGPTLCRLKPAAEKESID